jgi:hypothetical protein
VDEARYNEKQMSDEFEVMKSELDKNKERWKLIQARLVAEVERTNEENIGLKQATASRNAETDKLKQERDAAMRRHRQAQAELGTLRLKLSVAKEDLQKARTSRDEQLKESYRLRNKLGKTAFFAQANLKRIVEKFREQTNVAIQAAELQVLRADKVNRDLRGLGFWKLDKANCEVVQKNLTMDFLRLAFIHRGEITKLLEGQEVLVSQMQTELEAVAEPVVPAKTTKAAEVAKEEDDEETADEQEPSILHVISED